MLRRLARRLGGPPRRLPGQATEEDLYFCYRVLLNREPDSEGWSAWMQHIRGGHLSLKELAESFMDAPEFLRSHSQTRFAYLLATTPQVQLVELPGWKMFVPLHDLYIGEPIARQKVYEPHVAHHLRQQLRPGGVFVDVGANIGYFSLLGAVAVGPAGHVYAFEPNPQNCVLLRLSAEASQLANITVTQNAVGDREADWLLAVEGSNGHLRPLDSASGGGDAQLLVHTVVLDQVLTHVPRIDTIKIDVEGAEPAALRGMHGLLQRHRPAILTEFAPTMITAVSRAAPESYLDLLQEQGYDLYVLHGPEKSDAPQSTAQVLQRYEQAGLNHLDLLALPR